MSVAYKGRSFEKPGKFTEAFNSHFVIVAPKLALKIKREGSGNPLTHIDDRDLSTDTQQSLFLKATPDSIKFEIHGLKSAKSAGHDEIPVRIVKDAPDILCTSLTLSSMLPLKRESFQTCRRLQK